MESNDFSMALMFSAAYPALELVESLMFLVFAAE